MAAGSISMGRTVARAPDGKLSPALKQGYAWVDLIASGNATQHDLEAFNQWRRQSPDHEKAFTVAAKMRGTVKSRERISSDYWRPSLMERASTRRAVIGGAAGFLALAGYGAISPPLGLWPSLAELGSDYRTSVGERRQIGLGSGVVLELNARTSVSQLGQTAIALVNGEVAVRADGRQPFTVHAGPTLISASASEFDVRYDENGTCVTCLDGSLRVQNGGRQFVVPAAHQVRAVGGGFGLAVPIEPGVVTAWRRGWLMFHDAPISEVIAEINRYRPGRIVIASSALAQTRISFDFPIKRLDEAVQIVKITAKSSTAVGDILLLS